MAWKKVLIWVLKKVVKWLMANSTKEEIQAEVLGILVDKADDLLDMTIAELRNLAKAKGVSLESKRTKEEIVDILKTQLNLE